MGVIKAYYGMLEELENSIKAKYEAQEGSGKSSSDGILLIKSEYKLAYPNAFSDWSPLDDDIGVMPRAASAVEIVTGSAQPSAATTNHPTTLDDCVLLPGVSIGKLSSRKARDARAREIDANIIKRLTFPNPKRLSVFVEICPDEE